LVEKLSLEYIGTQAKKFLKAKKSNLLPRMKKWLADYEKLGTQEQQKLAKEKEDIQKVVEILKNGREETESNTTQTNSTTNWDVAKWIGGGLLVLVGISLILKVLKGK
jgi:uncharacterized protein YabN with tetrapyrrole methylase and pyrophosphatase domain